MAESTVDVLACEDYENDNNATLNNSDASTNKNDLKSCDSLTINQNSLPDVLENLSNFRVLKILRNDTTQKLIAVKGQFDGYDESALVVLEKKTFPNKDLLLKEAYFNDLTTVKKLYDNDIYRHYDLFPEKQQNALKVTIVHPATPKHIEKFSIPEFYLIEETPEIYKNVTLPYLQSQQLSIQWVNNILEGKSEVDRVIFNDTDEETGFVLVKDSKWDGELSTLHAIALTRINLRSIRDLNESHLPLLNKIKEAGTKAIKENYNLPSYKLRIFFHYQPSYYHLHVHFTALGVENAGALTERAHLLSTVIKNIEMVSDYYEKAVLTFSVPKYGAFKPYEKYLQLDKKRTKQDDDKPHAKRARFSI